MAGGRSFCASLFDRQVTGRRVTSRPFVRDFRCEENTPGAAAIVVEPDGKLTPPFTCAFNQEREGRQLLAVGDEEGYITIINTSQPLPDTLNKAFTAHPVRGQWPAHDNAIFDIAWCKGDTRMLTASGDQTVVLWDTYSAQRLGIFQGHEGSVKSVRPWAACHDVFATGARDGRLCLWDSRVPGRYNENAGGTSIAPVVRIKDAHGVGSGYRAQRRSSGRPLPAPNGVTSVVFLHNDTTLATGGAADGVVKLWDVRNVAEPVGCLRTPQNPQYPRPTVEATALAAIPLPSSMRPHGISGMVQDPTGPRLLVTVTSGSHYLYDVMHPDLPPMAEFRGHTVKSFYVRADFSPDGTHIVSGSSDKNAYIWEVRKPNAPPIVLEKHKGEVTGVAWCPGDFSKIVTCGDDARLCIWNIDRFASKLAATPVKLTATRQRSNQRAVLTPHRSPGLGVSAALSTASEGLRTVQPSVPGGRGLGPARQLPASAPQLARVQRPITDFFRPEAAPPPKRQRSTASCRGTPEQRGIGGGGVGAGPSRPMDGAQEEGGNNGCSSVKLGTPLGRTPRSHGGSKPTCVRRISLGGFTRGSASKRAAAGNSEEGGIASPAVRQSRQALADMLLSPYPSRVLPTALECPPIGTLPIPSFQPLYLPQPQIDQSGPQPQYSPQPAMASPQNHDPLQSAIPQSPTESSAAAAAALASLSRAPTPATMLQALLQPLLNTAPPGPPLLTHGGQSPALPPDIDTSLLCRSQLDMSAVLRVAALSAANMPRIGFPEAEQTVQSPPEGMFRRAAAQLRHPPRLPLAGFAEESMGDNDASRVTGSHMVTGDNSRASFDCNSQKENAPERENATAGPASPVKPAVRFFGRELEIRRGDNESENETRAGTPSASEFS